MHNAPTTSKPGFLSRIQIIYILLICVGSFTLVSAAGNTPATMREATAPDYRPFTRSYHLPFGNVKPVDFQHLSTLQVRISINGGPPMRFQVDMGSTDVIVAADDVPNVDLNGPAGSITYSSSGVELDGVWTPVTITFPD